MSQVVLSFSSHFCYSCSVVLLLLKTLNLFIAVVSVIALQRKTTEIFSNFSVAVLWQNGSVVYIVVNNANIVDYVTLNDCSLLAAVYVNSVTVLSELRFQKLTLLPPIPLRL